MAIGYKTKCKGQIGAWLVLSEAEQRNYVTYIKEVKTVFVDGETIKENVFYCLINGEVKEF
jgi:hypothetical protein